MGWWETVTQIGGLAGLGSLGLGAFNTWQARKQDAAKAEQERAKPAQERQRQLRERLRRLLLDAQGELKRLKQALDSGDPPPDDVLGIFVTLEEQIETLGTEGLTSPTSSWLTDIRTAAYMVPSDLENVKWYADRLKKAYSRDQVDTEEVEQASRKLNASRSRLQRQIDSALLSFEKWIGIVASMDDGDEKLIQRYKS
ncbi:hypothetical protein A5757_19250 [Mycobacterium sp. 852013-51886_SCH5428379]|uniref:hypothetical protein n=1 Tax=Mycobacterium sp. 852013-51886_SCH5428379 TaxID=1834111 RepID=UPI0007FFC16C|nr:hypothetical protein [Mycobacterium sp. 852013-51886_SCH5428379]OBB57954.1 hypothetical protein A5757_19250 [Mycobacterium sp. 852013-51886_SCH5428379]